MKIAILIQSNDKYDHLWEGLFLSWKLNWNWNEFDFPVYVITETKDFDIKYKNNNFHTIKVGEDIKDINNYSTKLIRALDYLKKLDFTHILYSQDDSWPLCTVDSLIINDVINFIKRKQIKCFYLHEHFKEFPFTLKYTNIYIQNKRVRRFARFSRFFYNHGNAFWDIDYLKSIQNIKENPSDNEPKTTERVWETQEPFYFINIPWYDQKLINNKGVLLESGENVLNQLKFRYKWEKVDYFCNSLISKHGVVMDLDPESDFYKSLSKEEISKLYDIDYGFYFGYLYQKFDNEVKEL